MLFTVALVLAPAYADVTLMAQALLLGMLLPFFVFMGLQSYILWSMRTLPTWGLVSPRPLASVYRQCRGAVLVHMALPRLELVTHGITNHPVHHLLPAIPIYNLAKAQAKYESLVGPLSVKHPFSLAGLVDTANRCKLYDFDQNRWLDFEGNQPGR